MNLKLAEMLAAEPVVFKSKFANGDTVYIDRDESITATVTGHIFRDRFVQVEVSWVHAGAVQTHWIDEWRLSPAP